LSKQITTYLPVLVLDDLSSSDAFSSLASDFFLVDLSSSFAVSFSSVFLLAESDSSVSQPRLRRPVVAVSVFFSIRRKKRKIDLYFYLRSI
jgi:hypothetical protein